MNTTALLFILLSVMLFARVWTPWGAGLAGPVVLRQPLSLYGRLRMHGAPAALLLGAALLALFTGMIDAWVVLAVLALLALLLAAPMRYTLTAQGIQAGQTAFRRWTEFGGVARRSGGVRLQGVAGARPLTVWLSGGREDDDFVLLLRQLVRGSYKYHEQAEADPASVVGAAVGTVRMVGVGGS